MSEEQVKRHEILERFSPEDLGILESNLLLGTDAWAIDEAHVRLHGCVCHVDLRDPQRPKIQNRSQEVQEYLTNPRLYFLRRFGRLSVEDQNKFMVFVMFPTATATERQLEQFDVAAFAIDVVLTRVLNEDFPVTTETTP